jgi:hypothetical protein
MGGAIECPLCGNNQAYCKCTRLEKQQFLEIARLREERRWVEGQAVISRETFDKVVAALSRCTIVADGDGDEWNDDQVIDALDSIRRDAEMLPPGPEKKEVPNG